MNEEKLREKFSGLSEESRKEIAELFPVLDPDDISSIAERCGKELDMKENKYFYEDENDTVEGVEVRGKTPWYRNPLIGAAASLAVVAGITGITLSGLRSVDVAEQSASYPAVIVEDETSPAVTAAAVTTEKLSSVVPAMVVTTAVSGQEKIPEPAEEYTGDENPHCDTGTEETPEQEPSSPTSSEPASIEIPGPLIDLSESAFSCTQGTWWGYENDDADTDIIAYVFDGNGSYHAVSRSGEIVSSGIITIRYEYGDVTVLRYDMSDNSGAFFGGFCFDSDTMFHIGRLRYVFYSGSTDAQNVINSIRFGNNEIE